MFTKNRRNFIAVLIAGFVGCLTRPFARSAGSEPAPKALDEALQARLAEIKNEGGLLTYVAKLQPVGMIVPFAGATPPEGWLLCDGQPVPDGPEYRFLRNLLGTTFDPAPAPAVKKVRVPDLCGRCPVGAGTGEGLTKTVPGDRFGTETVTLTAAQMPKHAHRERGKYNTENPDGLNGYHINQGGQSGTSFAGGERGSEEGADQPHENRQPSLVVNFIIRFA